LTLDVRHRLGSAAGVVAIAGVAKGKPVVVVATTEAAREAKLRAGEFVKIAASRLGGGGGGKPDLAQGGGTNPDGIDDALSAVSSEVAGIIGGKRSEEHTSELQSRF